MKTPTCNDSNENRTIAAKFPVDYNSNVFYNDCSKGESMPSVSEIARKAKVSKSTVSLALNDKPHVSPHMKERVMKALTELSARENENREAPRQDATILLLHPMSMESRQVFSELLQGIRTAVVEEAGGQLILASHDPPLKPEHVASALLYDPALKPDGVIVMAAFAEDPIIFTIRDEQLPCVLLARQQSPAGISCVGMDNTAGARSAVEHLYTLGHRRIAFAGGDKAFDYTGLRLLGYRECMEAHNLEPIVFLGKGEAATRALLDQVERPTAVLYVNDEHALAGLRVLREAGLTVPADISIIGFDDTDEAASADPPLTSVRVPRFRIGFLAGRSVLDHIRYPEIVHQSILMNTRLIVRDSVGKYS